MWTDILKRGSGKKSDKFYTALDRDVVALIKENGPMTASLIFQELKGNKRWGRSIANPTAMARYLMRLPSIAIRERTPGRTRGIREYYLG